MASEFFHELYQEAFRRDCSAIHSLNALAKALEPIDAIETTPTIERLVTVQLLQEARTDFLSDMRENIQAENPRCTFLDDICPHCGKHDCLDARPYQRSPVGIVLLSLPHPQSGK